MVQGKAGEGDTKRKANHLLGGNVRGRFVERQRTEMVSNSYRHECVHACGCFFIIESTCIMLAGVL